MPATITKGEALYNDGRVEEARDSFLEVLKTDTKNKEAWNNLGVIAYGEFAYGKAARCLSQALEVDPFYKEAIINLCDVLRDTRQLKSAINLLEVAIVQNPEDIELQGLVKEARQIVVPQETKKTEKTTEVDLKKLHVLQGTHEIANQSYTISSALKAQGMYAKTLCYYPNYFKYKSDYVIDLSLCANREDAILRTRKYAEQMIPQFDIFHFHFGKTLTFDYSDLPWLKEKNKKVVSQYWGSECRMLSIAKKLNPYIKVKDKTEDVIKTELEEMSKYVRHCIVGDYELYEYVKDYFEHIHVIPSLIDTEKYRPDPDRLPNDKFVIVHAPTDTDLKGSLVIQRVLQELLVDHEFECRFVQGMSHKEAMKNYQQADLIIDELHCGSYGLLSVETMAMAKPVVTWISDFMKEKYPSDLPIISANPDTLKDVIKDTLENREMLAEKGQQGRAYVEKYHDMNKVVLQIQDVYREL
ncbi:MAG: tetratricopeptide repeat protein [candidate division Zixibacteria bacterium]|nr:tetratricopeptide repeat protein [candidate division Zixibacteria bacterium]